MCCKLKDYSFSDLGNPNQLWVIPSIHGDLHRLMRIHDAIFPKIRAGDRIVYLGNYTGYGEHSRETVDELLMFRRMVLSKPAMKATDITYLRGKQENLWQRLYQIPYDLFPAEGLMDLMGNGLKATMNSYDICPHDGINAARDGIVALTKWTNHIRERLRIHDGHDKFMTHQHRAAFTSFTTSDAENHPLLFVNTNIDTTKSLDNQQGSFWDDTFEFKAMTQAYAPYNKVIRGYDPFHKGLDMNDISATLDAGCGFGGSLIAAQMTASGEFIEVLEA